MTHDSLLRVENLQIEFCTAREKLQALRGVSFDVKPGEIFGLVGETGCGKTAIGLAILRLIPQPGQITAGKIIFQNNDLLQKPEKEMQDIRGRKIAMIFQDPSTSLNPVFTVGSQIEKVIRVHSGLDAHQTRSHMLDMLGAVGLPDVKRIANSYPHQLSGGMQQRAMIAMALSCQPALLIADEPTTALDVTIQSQILSLLRDLQKQFNIALILITHNLGVVAETCDRLAVLYAGRVVETGSAHALFQTPHHPYTRGLMDAIPRRGSRGKPLASIIGTVPANPGLVTGCSFAPRCSYAFWKCQIESPDYIQLADDHQSACFFPFKSKT